MKRYEALLALDTQGKEDTVKETIERIEKVITAEGATIEQVQRLEKRELAYESQHKKSAYFVNFIFEADPTTIDKLRKKLKLDGDVVLQNYVQLPAKKKAAAAA
ncbi:MAG: 30S ribosomal protein S6 [Chthoniobacterales bacterium]|nr:30S ribosomal protein S6 [Chthoniobacterales bacterium]